MMHDHFHLVFQIHLLSHYPLSTTQSILVFRLVTGIYREKKDYLGMCVSHRWIRYYNNMEEVKCTPEMLEYTETFVRTIEAIKRRHDPVVTTVGKHTYTCMIDLDLKSDWVS